MSESNEIKHLLDDATQFTFGDQLGYLEGRYGAKPWWRKHLAADRVTVTLNSIMIEFQIRRPDQHWRAIVALDEEKSIRTEYLGTLSAACDAIDELLIEALRKDLEVIQ